MTMTNPSPSPAAGQPEPPVSFPECVRAYYPPAAGLPRVAPTDLFAALRADARSENTRRSRHYDGLAFARFLGLGDDAAAAFATLIAGGAGEANALALAFRSHLRGRGLAWSSVNRHLATLRRAVVMARRLGLCGFALDVDPMPVRPFRDTRGPGLEGWRAIEAAAIAAGDGPLARRNRAILALLHGGALRRGEAVSLDVGDLDLGGSRVAVMGKGRGAKEWATVGASTARALADWLAVRGPAPGPLFNRVCRSGRVDVASRIDGATINRHLRALSRAAGLARHARPHGLRHQAITRALDLTGGDIRAVAKFARHANPRTTIVYDDNRRDLAGDVARLLGSEAAAPPPG